jgi:hypothetical protein
VEEKGKGDDNGFQALMQKEAAENANRLVKQIAAGKAGFASVTPNAQIAKSSGEFRSRMKESFAMLGEANNEKVCGIALKGNQKLEEAIAEDKIQRKMLPLQS